MNVASVFRPLSDLERSMADLYAQWGGLFDEDREAAFLFVKMANEERGHAALVDYQRRVIQKNPQLSGEVEIDMGSIQGALAEVIELRESPSKPSLEEAIRLAYRLETSAAESHYRNALGEMNPELLRLLSCLGGEDRAHLDRLVKFATSRGISLPVRSA